MKIVSLSTFTLIAALLFFACNNKLKVDSNSFNLSQPFPIKLFETSKMVNGDLALTLTGLPEDSRCPQDANCIWEGQVRLFVEAATGAEKKSIEFKIEKSKMGKVTKSFKNYNIVVQNVLPQTQSGIRIAKEEYIVTLQVTPK